MKKTKLEKIMTIAPITLAFILVGILVLGIMDVITLNRFMIDSLLILGIICFGCIACFPATKILSKDRKNIYAYIILGLTGLTCLLWIIFVFVGQSFIDYIVSSDSVDFSTLHGIWGYTKITIFITIQTSLASLVVSYLHTLKKEYLAFQIVMYISNFIVDLWLSILILSVGVNETGLTFAGSWLINSKLSITIFVLATSFSILAGAIMKTIIKKRTKDIVLEKDTLVKTVKDNNAMVDTNSIENRIRKLDELREKGVITEQEYADKKAEILKEI